MASLFRRSARVVVAQPTAGATLGTYTGQTIEIEDLRMSFSIVRTSGKEPNTAEIKITNLASSTRAGLQKSSRIVFLAGYADTLGQLFTGDLRSAEHKHNGVDWETILRGGDGERATKGARVSESFPPGVPVEKMIGLIGKATKLDVGNLLVKAPAAGAGEQYTQGAAVYGRAVPELARILEARGYEMSIQDGRIQVLGPGESTTESAVELSPDSGLVGSPELGTPEKKGGPPTMRALSLLQPEIKPGRRVVVNSRHVSGVFIARKVSHRGDTAGGDWYSEIEAVQA